MSVKPITTNTASAAANLVNAPAYLRWILVANSSSTQGLQATLNDATTGTASIELTIEVPLADTFFADFGADYLFDAAIRLGVCEAGLHVTAGYVVASG